MAPRVALHGMARTLTPAPVSPLGLALAIVLIAAAGCATTPAPTPTSVASPAPAPKPTIAPAPAPTVAAPAGFKPLVTSRSWTNAIRDEGEFTRYSKQVARDRYVKALFDLHDDAAFYFDVNVYPFHEAFAFHEFYTEAATDERRQAFRRNYGPVKPDFLLVTVANHLDSDMWTFSFWEGDKMTAEHVKAAYKRLKKTFFMAPKLRFLPTSPRQEELAAKLKTVPTTTLDSLYRLTEQHTFNIGRRVGVLRIVGPDADPAKLTFHPNEIVILARPLPDLTAVSGIISEQFSTPLAHVNLRAAAWGIPHIGLRGASKRYAALAGKVVFFEATEGGYTLREATADERTLMDTAVQHDEVALPGANLDTKELLPLEHMRASQVTAYGAKAANLGEVAHAKLPGVRVPHGFGIPIFYYARHMRRNKLDKRVDELLKDPAFQRSAEVRKAKLAELRRAIVEAPLDSALLQGVWERVEAFHLAPGRGVFVRSSTNAEDLPGFTGAGLYTTVPNVVGKEAIANAIREVWASVWNFRAYEERAFHGIDHKGVYGAVLVQVGMNATAAGVLVTRNIFDSTDRGTYTINAKSGLGIRVVGGRKIPEQILYNRDKGTMRVISRSDEDTMLVFDDKGGIKEAPTPKGQPILTDQRVFALGEAAGAVAALFPKVDALDIEWLFERDVLFIVQARPFVTR